MATKWIIEAVQANTDEEGKVDVEKLTTAINSEYPKHAVPKDQYNTQAEKLKAANETLTNLQESNKDAEALQAEITKYKAQAEQLESYLIVDNFEASGWLTFVFRPFVAFAAFSFLPLRLVLIQGFSSFVNVFA